MNEKIVIFYHVYQGRGWKKIVRDQLDLIRSSGLYSVCERIFIGLSGDRPLPLDSKITVTQNKNRTDERDTLLALHRFAAMNPGYFVLYLHTKGTGNNSRFNGDWRRYMEYFTVEKWKKCVSLLGEFDCCGVMWNPDTFLGYHPHFSGNFW